MVKTMSFIGESYSGCHRRKKVGNAQRPTDPIKHMKPSQQEIRKFVAKGKRDRELIKELLNKKPKSNK